MGLYFNKEVTFQYGTDTRGKNNFFNIVNKSEKIEINNCKNIDYKEATLLGLALSINRLITITHFHRKIEGTRYLVKYF